MVYTNVATPKIKYVHVCTQSMNYKYVVRGGI